MCVSSKGSSFSMEISNIRRQPTTNYSGPPDSAECGLVFLEACSGGMELFLPDHGEFPHVAGLIGFIDDFPANDFL